MKKILISLMVCLVALVATAVPVGAQGMGPLAVAVDEMKINVDHTNFGVVTNFVFARANTGWNFTYGQGTDVETGNATINAGVGTGMNSNTTGVMLADAEWGPFAVNFGFGELESGGEDSVEGLCCPPRCRFPMPCWMRMALGYWLWTGNPVAIAWDNTEIDVHNFNIGVVSNDLMLFANTGHNLTVGSEVDTGDASIIANVGTTLNTNTTSISMYESGIGPVAVNFEFGGGGYVPLAVAAESDRISVSNFNFGVVENNVFARANTGWNDTYGEGADVDTGNASVGTTVSNTVNTNTTSITKTDMAVGPIAANVDLYDGGCGISGIPCLSAGGVGPVAANVGTSGIAVAVESDSIGVSNDNTAIVTNNEVLLANTGHNETSGCPVDPCPSEPPCGPGCPMAEVETPPATTVDTGDASVTTNITNTVNTNSTTITVGEGAPMLP